MTERHVRRLEAGLATVGVDIPASVEVLGRRLMLEEMLFEVLSGGREDVGAIDRLRAELVPLLGEVRSALASLDGPEAEELLRAGLALRKAIEITGPATENDRTDDTKRWLEFVKRIRG